MASGSSSILSNDETLLVSYEDSSSPTENQDSELELGLSLSLGHKRYEDSSSSSSSSKFFYVVDDSSSSSSSVSAAFKTTPAPDSMPAATSGQVVGWPPIRTYRMNNTINQTKTLSTQHSNISNNNKTDSNIRNSIFVKVTMDGIPIGRKIDLNAHKSYDSLSKTLEEMFLNPEKQGLSEGFAGFVLTYEDKEGDWMLVGDVPWGMFIGSVKRLRIMKTFEATGTAQMML